MFVQIFSRTQLTKEAWLGAFPKIPLLSCYIWRKLVVYSSNMPVFLCPSNHPYKFINLPFVFDAPYEIIFIGTTLIYFFPTALLVMTFNFR